MRIAVTGATGFIGRYLVRELAAASHSLRCWHRAGSDRSGFGDRAAARPGAPPIQPLAPSACSSQAVGAIG